MTERETRRRSQKPTDSEASALAVPERGLAAVFDDFMQPFFTRPMRLLWAELEGREPVVDFQDRGDHYTLTAELPGFTKDDVEVLVDRNSLELRAEKSVKEEKGKGLYGRSYTSYQRRYTLPERVLAEKVDGTMTNGVLELRIPKMESKPAQNPRKVDLK